MVNIYYWSFARFEFINIDSSSANLFDALGGGLASLFAFELGLYKNGIKQLLSSILEENSVTQSNASDFKKKNELTRKIAVTLSNARICMYSYGAPRLDIIKTIIIYSSIDSNWLYYYIQSW